MKWTFESTHMRHPGGGGVSDALLARKPPHTFSRALPQIISYIIYLFLKREMKKHNTNFEDVRRHAEHLSYYY